MPRLPSTLLALALATALSAPLWAQQISTSRGVRTLPKTDGYRTEQQYRQAALAAEDVILEILQDVAASEKARGAATGSAAGIAGDVKRTNAELAAAVAAFDEKDKKYRADLSAFEQRQAALEADVLRQRQQASVLEALPSAQRDHAEIVRLNDWAVQLGNTRKQIEADRARLLADHQAVEEERARVAQQRTAAEAKLNNSRSGTIGAFDQAQTQRAAAYRNLKTAVNYLRQVRDAEAKLTKVPLARSEVLESSMQKLRAYESGAPLN